MARLEQKRPPDALVCERYAVRMQDDVATQLDVSMQAHAGIALDEIIYLESSTPR